MGGGSKTAVVAAIQQPAMPSGQTVKDGTPHSQRDEEEFAGLFEEDRHLIRREGGSDPIGHFLLVKSRGGACYLCKRDGHWSRDCPERKTHPGMSQAYKEASKCNVCGGPHAGAYCPGRCRSSGCRGTKPHAQDAACRQLWKASSAEPPPKRPTWAVCYRFRDVGSCRFGSNCRFTHEATQTRARREDEPRRDRHADSKRRDQPRGRVSDRRRTIHSDRRPVFGKRYD